MDEDIKNAILIMKLDKQKRRRNEKIFEEKIGVERTLKEFHQPVLEEIKKQDITRKQQIEAIQNLADNLSIIPQDESSKILTEPLPIEPDYSSDAANLFERAEDIFKIHFNKNLDTSFIKKEGFELPSELINKTEDELNKIINAAKIRRDEYKRAKGNASKHNKTDAVKYADNRMNAMKKYIKALNTLKLGREYIGEGLSPLIDKLELLTDKICQNGKCPKIYNQVIVLLDRLLKEGIMTNDQVKQYYNTYLLP